MQQSTQPEQKVIQLFHRAYKTCPAYKHFVDQLNIDANSIVSPRDIKKIPIMDKDNYIKKYPLHKKIIDNKDLSDFYMITSSSGSTGKPTYWPRSLDIDEGLELVKQALYEQHFKISTKKTLIINTFALGIWTAGMLTSKLSWGASKHNSITVASTGLSEDKVLECFQNIAKYFDQIIVLGYPPFLLDAFEYLHSHDISFQKHDVKIMYTSDSISLNTKEYLLSLINKVDCPEDVVGFYACTDTGIIAAQTPLTAQLFSKKNQDAFKNCHVTDLDDNLAIFSYDPTKKYIEEIDGELIITADQPVPLIRYNIHDRGGILSGKKLKLILKHNDIAFADADIDDHNIFIKGRSDSVLLTANIYIEDIKYCIENSTFNNRLTGNFKYGIKETKNNRKTLAVHVYTTNKSAFSAQEKKLFKQEFERLLTEVNSDLRAVKGNQMRGFSVKFLVDRKDKYANSKLHHFL